MHRCGAFETPCTGPLLSHVQTCCHEAECTGGLSSRLRILSALFHLFFADWVILVKLCYGDSTGIAESAGCLGVGFFKVCSCGRSSRDLRPKSWRNRRVVP